jgi:hypothetical protein
MDKTGDGTAMASYTRASKPPLAAFVSRPEREQK